MFKITFVIIKLFLRSNQSKIMCAAYYENKMYCTFKIKYW